jgi:hypothetical protein
MITVYFDMDGVLTDLDGMLAAKAGVHRDAMKDSAFRSTWINRSIGEDQVAHWRDIPANRHGEFRAVMSWLRLRGVTIEILTSYGLSTMGDCGALAHTGKVKWLTAHYLAEFQNKTISRFNGVQNCWQKQHFAAPTSILVDDQPENVAQWRAAGGVAVLYNLEHHDVFIDEFERIILEKT